MPGMPSASAIVWPEIDSGTLYSRASYPRHAARASSFSLSMNSPAARDTPMMRRWGLSMESIHDWPMSPRMNSNGSMSTGAKSSPQEAASPLKARSVASLHLVSRGGEAGTKGRGGPHVALGTDCKDCYSHA